MVAFTAKQSFEHGQTTQIGVLVCNLGTPSAATTSAVRRYLSEFLADRRVVELSPWLWLPILHGLILRLRPRKSAAAYRKVWSENGSPLLDISRRQIEGLKRELGADQKPYFVELGMRYGEPSISSALQRLREHSARQILVLPLYPQYASATVGSVFDAVTNEIKQWRWVPELRFVNEYHLDARYLDALAASVNEHWRQHSRGEHLLMSFHGIPEEYFLAGDPYFCQCHATARELASRLHLGEGEWTMSFQSKVGPKRWLHPYTDETVKALGAGGMKQIDVICPGFAADCLETLEEIVVQNQEFFVAAGGERLNYIPALNDSVAHLRFLSNLIRENCAGWPGSEDGWDQSLADDRQQRAKVRATELQAALKRSV